MATDEYESDGVIVIVAICMVVVAVIIGIGFLVWRLTSHQVPIVTQIGVTSWSLELPFGISRWWDVPAVLAFALLILNRCTSQYRRTWEDRLLIGLFIGFVFGAFYGWLLGLIVGLIIWLCYAFLWTWMCEEFSRLLPHLVRLIERLMARNPFLRWRMHPNLAELYLVACGHGDELDLEPGYWPAAKVQRHLGRCKRCRLNMKDMIPEEAERYYTKSWRRD